MRLLPFSTVIGVNGSRVLPLSRAWHELANGTRSATPLSRPVGGYGSISRPPRDHVTSLGTRHCHGDRASIRVWCSQGGVHLLREIKSADETAGRRRQALERGKKAKNRSKGAVCLLTIGVLIRVRLLSHDLNAALAQAVLVPKLIRVTAPSGGLTMESRTDHAGQAPYSISSKCNAYYNANFQTNLRFTLRFRNALSFFAHLLLLGRLYG